MYSRNRKLLLAALAGGCLFTGQASAAVFDIGSSTVIFQDDFDSYEVGDARPLENSHPDRFPRIRASADSSVEIVEDVSNVFGGGTSNRYLSIYDGSDGNTEGGASTDGLSALFSHAQGTSLFMVSFDYYEPSARHWDPTDDRNTINFFTTSGPDNNTTSSSNMQVNIRHGGLHEDLDENEPLVGQILNNDGSSRVNTGGRYALDQAVHWDIVINPTLSAVTYTVDGVDYTVAAQRYDLWIDDVLEVSDGAFRNTGNYEDGIRGFGFIANGNPTSMGNYDNVVAIGIPEPASLALLGLGGLLMLRRRK